MKKIYFLIVALLLMPGLQAQVVKTMENTAGDLDSLLTENELNTITDLTLTGTMDARDFKTIQIYMPAITSLDISRVTVAGYSGTEIRGPATEANKINSGAFRWKDQLTTLVLPSSITDIGYEAFWGCSSLTSVTIPPLVTRLDDGAFMKCSSLTTVTLSSALTTIGIKAFAECSSLTSLTIPSSVNYIGNNAFYNCSSITGMVIPSLVTTIERGTFSGCSSLSSVTLPSSVTAIGENAFFNCNALTSLGLPPGITTIEPYCFAGCQSLAAVTLPSGVTAIASNAFSDCSSLTSISLPSAVTTIGNNAFANCSALKDATLPVALTVIEPAVFYGCSSLTSILIPASVSSIRQNAFAGCKRLTSIVIPSLATSIGNSAFEGCEKVETLTIPSLVSSIGSKAFSGCTTIKTIRSERSVPVALDGTVFDPLDKSSCTLHVPFGSEANYATSDEWQDFKIVADTTGFSTSISSLTVDFEGTETQVAILGNSTWQASSDQPWLTVSPTSGTSGTLTVSIQANTTLNDRFATITLTPAEGNAQLISVTQTSDPKPIPVTPDSFLITLTPKEKNTITRLILSGTINTYTIKSIESGLPLLKELDLSATTIIAVQLDGIVSKANWWPGPTLTRYPSNFGGLRKPSLTSIKLPSTLEVIGYRGFAECTGLTDITIPPTVSTIGESAFESCTSLTSISFPSSVTSVGSWAFAECTGLTEFTWPTGMTSIGRSVFVNCTGFTTLDIPGDIRNIGFEAFRGCSGIIVLSLPEALKSIDNMAFAYCTSLDSIYSRSPEPPKLHGSFDRSIYTTCALYVPFGSRAAYAAADEWKNFTHIVEVPGMAFSASELTLEAVNGVQQVKILTDGPWSATNYNEWLILSPSSGDTAQTINFTALDNTSPELRTAVIVFTAANGNSQNITVTQHGLVTGMDQRTSQDALTCYPNPFSDQMTIDIANPSLKEVSVDIYSISGQKIKSLLKAQKGAKISCTWNGTDEQGMAVPQGVYLLKMNEKVRKVEKK